MDLGPNGLPLANLGDPAYKGQRRYVVTLHNWDDNESLYNDMENNGGPLHVPQRVVECADRRPEERNTEYLLTYKEAVALSFDSRVASVELNPEDLGLVITRHDWISTSTFSKAIALTGSDINWGLYRTRVKINPANWGRDGTLTLSTTTVLADSSGKNVDVVVMDGGLPYPNTLEFCQNTDGTGYTRTVQYNWFQHTASVNSGTNSNYSYSTLANGHQAHTSGTAAGNRQGFARDANIYNLTFNDSILYIREFHKNKSVNPLTGIPNPTVTNHSWGYSNPPISSYTVLKNSMSRIHYRGTDYFPTSGSTGSFVWSNVTVQACGIPSQFGNGFPARNTAADANMIDCAKSGVINVCSAGNNFWHTAKPSADPNDDYNNYLVWNGGVYYYHRGTSPGSACDTDLSLDYAPICVGSMGAVVTGTMTTNTVNYLYGISGGFTGLLSADYKSEFSNYGPRVDVYAPGEAVISVIDSTSYSSGIVVDTRQSSLGINENNSVYGRDAGTSMSGPHVCGVIACVLEKYPRMSMPDIRQWIASNSIPSLNGTPGGAGDATDYGSWSTASNNKVLFLPGTRLKETETSEYISVPYPIINNNKRSTSGQVWPRPNMLMSRNTATLALTASPGSVVTSGTVTIQLLTNGLADGTKVPYIISTRSIGVFKENTATYKTLIANSSTVLIGTIQNFSSRPNTGNRIVTLGSNTGTWSTITNTLIGSASLTSSTTPTFGNNDDGCWQLTVPWNVSFNGTSYTTIGVGTNGYIVFGNTSNAYLNISQSNPPFPKIEISAGDISCQRIYYGVEGTSPNQTYRIRWEGHYSFQNGVLGSPTILWESTFYQATSNRIDINLGINKAWGSLYDFVPSIISGTPLTGNFTVTNNTATLPIIVNNTVTTSAYTINVRTNTYPAASVDFNIN